MMRLGKKLGEKRQTTIVDKESFRKLVMFHFNISWVFY